MLKTKFTPLRSTTSQATPGFRASENVANEGPETPPPPEARTLRGGVGGARQPIPRKIMVPPGRGGRRRGTRARPEVAWGVGWAGLRAGSGRPWLVSVCTAAEEMLGESGRSELEDG